MPIDIPKLIDTDEGKFHYCINCEEYKPITDFYLCPRCKSGYQYRCIPCHHVRYRELNPEPISDEEALKFILTKMGYDTNSEKTINEQFIEKVFEKSGLDLTIPIKRKRKKGKYKHLNPPPCGTTDYYNWYNKEIRRKKD
jgi:hypothetical protein